MYPLFQWNKIRYITRGYLVKRGIILHQTEYKVTVFDKQTVAAFGRGIIITYDRLVAVIVQPDICFDGKTGGTEIICWFLCKAFGRCSVKIQIICVFVTIVAAV